MSTTTSTTTDDAEAPAQEWLATLTRGRIYILPHLTFESGVEVRIDDATKNYLEKNAFDIVSVEGEAEFQERQKFTFAVAPPKKAEVPARRR